MMKTLSIVWQRQFETPRDVYPREVILLQSILRLVLKV